MHRTRGPWRGACSRLPQRRRRGSVLVLVRREETAVDAVGTGRVVEHEVAHPVAVATRCGVLEALVLQIVSDDFGRTCVLENRGGPGGLDGSARMHGDRGGLAAIDPLGERIRERALILLTE